MLRRYREANPFAIRLWELGQALGGRLQEDGTKLQWARELEMLKGIEAYADGIVMTEHYQPET